MLGVLYGGFAYLAFAASFLCFIAFLDGAGLPRTVDTGPVVPVAEAAARAIGWLLLFGLQHSVMARPTWKRAVARAVPPHLERSTYVLVTSLLLLVLPVAWRPIPKVLWHVDAPIARAALHAVGHAGFALIAVATLLLDHLEFFGLRQPWSHWRGLAPSTSELRTPALYRFVRHPIYLGFLLAFWCVPTMTAGHLLFSAGMSAYLLVGVTLEERDLVAHFGDAYRDYRRRVPMLLPWRPPRP